MLRCALLLSTIALAPSLQAQERPAYVRESESGYKFPTTRTVEDGKDVLHLAGTAIREKTVFNVNVYAYGLYLDPYGAQEHLAKWKDKSPKELQKDKKFYAEICKDNFTKSIRLVLCRNIDGDDLESAFEDSLEPRLKKAKKDFEWPDASKELATFKSFWKLDKLKKKAEVVFTWEPGNKLVCTIDGKRQKEIVSKALTWALFDIYLGEDPIESGGKKRMIELTPEIMSAKLPPKKKPTVSFGPKKDASKKQSGG